MSFGDCVGSVMMNPARCPCKGSGWAVSAYDTYHRCPLHHDADSVHPDASEVNEGADHLRHLRKAYLYFVNQALPHFGGDKDRVKEAVARECQGSTPTDLVNAAEEVYLGCL